MGSDCSKPMEPVLLPHHKRRFVVRHSHSLSRRAGGRNTDSTLGSVRFYQHNNRSFTDVASFQARHCTLATAESPRVTACSSNPLFHAKTPSDEAKVQLASELLAESQRRLKLFSSPISTRCVSVTFDCGDGSMDDTDSTCLPKRPMKPCKRIDEFDGLRSVTVEFNHG